MLLVGTELESQVTPTVREEPIFWFESELCAVNLELREVVIVLSSVVAPSFIPVRRNLSCVLVCSLAP